MISKIKSRIEKTLVRVIMPRAAFPWISLPAPYRARLRGYLLRKGKRLRPVLFILGYLGFASRPAAALYTSAVALELLHAFILIHDDLIDHEACRRGGPSLHRLMERQLRAGPPARVRGSDLALIMGDVLYALAIRAFLSIRASPVRKQQALERLTRAALVTGSGELQELLYTRTPLDRLNRAAIGRIYERKTAHYSFALPLAMGATLAGATPQAIDSLARFGLCLGRAFQIKDDLGGGKGASAPVIADIREGKRTLLLLYAFRSGSPRDRKFLKRVYGRRSNAPDELRRAADIILRSDVVRHAVLDMGRLSKQADRFLRAIPIKPQIRDALLTYKEELLAMPESGRVNAQSAGRQSL